MTTPIQLYGRPLWLLSSEEPAAIAVDGTLPGFVLGQAYEGRLQISNNEGDCRAYVLAGSSLPDGTSVSVDQSTSEVVIAFSTPADDTSTDVPDASITADNGWALGPGWGVESRYGVNVLSHRNLRGYYEAINNSPVSVQPSTTYHAQVRVEQDGGEAGWSGDGILMVWYDENHNVIRKDGGTSFSTTGVAKQHISNFDGNSPSNAAYVAIGVQTYRARNNKPIFMWDFQWDVAWKTTVSPGDMLPVHLMVIDAVHRKAYWDGILSQHLALAGTLPAAKVGTAYEGFLDISGGDGVYSNPRATAGTLPSWASLQIVGTVGAYRLRVYGSPAGASTVVNVTLAVDSGDGQTATSAQSITVTNMDVRSLLRFAGTNGSTTVLDDISANAWSVSGGTNISTAKPLFSAPTLHCNGASFGCSTNLVGPGAGDFTVEAFVSFENIAANGNQSWLNLRGLGIGYSIFLFKAAMNIYVTDAFGTNLLNSGSTVIVPSTYTHIALVRKSGVLSLFISGHKVASVTHTQVINTMNPVIGSADYSGVSRYLDGYVAQFRISYSAVYDADFVPPTGQLPPV